MAYDIILSESIILMTLIQVIPTQRDELFECEVVPHNFEALTLVLHYNSGRGDCSILYQKNSSKRHDDF